MRTDSSKRPVLICLSANKFKRKSGTPAAGPGGKRATMKIIALLCSCFFTTAALAQVNLVAISNTNQPNPGYYIDVGAGNMIATSFTTTGVTTNPFAVTVVLNGSFAFQGPGMPPAFLGPFQLGIYSDAGGSPGSSLGVLSGNSNPNAAGVYSYSDTTGLVLATNTTYWIVASSPGTSGEASYEWSMTPSSSADSGSFWTQGVSKAYSSGSWTPVGDDVFFAVTITATPPALSISHPIMLVYPGQIPFALQQNPDLAGTNWNTVTNAILTCTTNNQTAIILPSSTGQMFYRLSP